MRVKERGVRVRVRVGVRVRVRVGVRVRVRVRGARGGAAHRVSTPHPPPTVTFPLTPSRWHSSSRSSSVSAASRAVSAPMRQPRAACRLSACLSRARPYRGWAACFRGPARECTPRLAATRRALEWSCVPKRHSCVLRARLGEQGPGRGRAFVGVWGARWVRTPGRAPTKCISVCIRESCGVVCLGDPACDRSLSSRAVSGRGICAANCSMQLQRVRDERGASGRLPISL